MALISIPDELAKTIRQRGFDLEAFVLEAIAEKLSWSDPREEFETRLGIAKYMLRRAREEMGKGDAVQASEKLYKAVEECIKVLACLEGLEECRRAKEEGGWWTKLLGKAARRLSRLLGEPLILEAWLQAYDLHIHGFHEHAYTVEEVKEALPVAEKLVEYTEERVRNMIARR